MAHKPAPKPPLTREAYIEARIEQAIARRGPMPKKLADEMRDALRLAYALHPQANALVERLRPRPELAHSDEIPGQGAEAQAKAELKRKGGSS